MSVSLLAERINSDNLFWILPIRFAVSKPNLFNVAVTRAKKGLIIVGNYETWKETKPEWFDLERNGILKGLIELVT